MRARSWRISRTPALSGRRWRPKRRWPHPLESHSEEGSLVSTPGVSDRAPLHSRAPRTQGDITFPKMTILQPLFLVFCVLSTAFYAARFWGVFAAGELFHRLGFDWSLFYAQPMAVRAGAGARMY